MQKKVKVAHTRLRKFMRFSQIQHNFKSIEYLYKLGKE